MMVETVTRKWGNSLGITLPKDDVKKEHFKVNERVVVLVLKSTQTPCRTFGMFQGRISKSAQEIKDKLRSELYHGS